MVGEMTPVAINVNCSRKAPRCGRIKFGDWCSFSDLDNFNSDYLISTLTANAQTDKGIPFTWTSVDMKCKPTDVPLIALRQAEAVFNLSQLMFALYHGSISACTFLDLQHNQPPRDIRKHGFKKLDNSSLQSGSLFRQALHSLCWSITESGGLPVIFSMMKNPVLPIIRQKCLDALTNILCVDNIEKVVLERQPWFLERLVHMVSHGDLQCDMVPAISVLDRLVVVILSEKMEEPYQQLMKLKFIDTCLMRLQSTSYSSACMHLHFVKFQTIAMQAVALLCANEQSVLWSKHVQERIFMHCFRSVLLWNTDQPPSDPIWHQSESFYRSMSFSSSALLFSFVVLVHSVLKWPQVHDFLKGQALAFKYQLSKILTVESLIASNSGADPNGPIIMNSVEWLWKSLYSNELNEHENKETSTLSAPVLDPLPELCERVLRCCSHGKCGKRENTVGQWKVCENCGVCCYCSDGCLVFHQMNGHGTELCKFLAMRNIEEFPALAKNPSSSTCKRPCF